MNRIEIQEILLILQLETGYFSKLFISESAPFEAVVLQSSQGLPELLFYTKKSYRILQLQLQLQFYKGTRTPSIHIQPTRAHYKYIQRILHPEYNSTCRRQRALRVLLLQIPVSRNSTHRRQGDLLEIHPCVLQDLPVTFQAFSRKSLQRQLQLLQLLQRHSSLSRHSRHSSHS